MATRDNPAIEFVAVTVRFEEHHLSVDVVEVTSLDLPDQDGAAGLVGDGLDGGQDALHIFQNESSY
ncbi:MAG: hypothetical protein IPH10_08725 [bacterium]|nr:hypothetical protein [bacterium]